MTVLEAELIDHPLSLSIALIWATTVFLWTGDLAAAERYIVQLASCAEANALAPYRVVARAFEGELAIRQGDAKTGIEILRTCIRDLHAAPCELVTTPLKIAFAQGLGALGRAAEAMAAVEEAICSVGANGDTCYLPELLRLKAQLLLSHAGDRRDARSCLLWSLRESRRQGALGWELRIAIDLAHLLVQEGLPDRARNLLQRAVSRFDEGEDTLDVRAAKTSMATIH